MVAVEGVAVTDFDVASRWFHWRWSVRGCGRSAESRWPRQCGKHLVWRQLVEQPA